MAGKASAKSWGRMKRQEQQASLYRLSRAWFSKSYFTYERTPRKPVSLLPRSTGSAPPPRQRLVVLIERIFYTRARDLQIMALWHLMPMRAGARRDLDFSSHLNAQRGD